MIEVCYHKEVETDFYNKSKAVTLTLNTKQGEIGLLLADSI